MKAIARSRMQVIRMATALLIRLRRAERMVEGQLCRSVILPFSIPCNLFPHAMYEEAATPNESEHGFFHFFSSGDSHRMERGSKGRQSIASRRVVRGAYIPCVCWPSEIGDGFSYASDTLSGEEDSSLIFLTGSLVQHYSVNQ